jgi:predicted nuclease with TOPRIM domain
MALQNNIKEWVVLDNKIKKINDSMKEFKDKKNELTDKILDHISINNMNINTINISDGKLNFIETKQATILSYKFLQECFKEFFINDEHKANELFEFIKNKRTYTTNPSIKRLYNKE